MMSGEPGGRGKSLKGVEMFRRSRCHRRILFMLAGSIMSGAMGHAADQYSGRGKSEPVSKELADRMRRSGSYKDGCPVPPEQLRLLTIPHWDFHKKIQIGALVIHEAVAEQVLDIFEDLRHAGFPIEKMRLIEEYEANDDASMDDNNSSAFNCRPITGMTGNFSNHSYGKAIDINPVQNPYLKITKAADAEAFLKEVPASAAASQFPSELTRYCMRFAEQCQVLPAQGARYLKRDKAPGVIVKDDAVYRAFTKRGWTWGGSWPSSRGNRPRTDYQHFEKAIKSDAAY